jgi:hypothetical protein
VSVVRDYGVGGAVDVSAIRQLTGRMGLYRVGAGVC